jgi:hypothetical protein
MEQNKSPEQPNSADFISTIAKKRTTEQIIKESIEHNRPVERLLYAFSVGIFLVGAASLVGGLYQGELILTIIGPIASALFIPAMKWANKIRQQNFSIRLLEIPLSKAETSEEAAKALREFFLKTWESK